MPRYYVVERTEEAGMESLLREMLSSEPEIVAWLEPREVEDDDEPARVS